MESRKRPRDRQVARVAARCGGSCRGCPQASNPASPKEGTPPREGSGAERGGGLPSWVQVRG